MSKTVVARGGKALASKKLAREKVLEAIFSLPAEMRAEAKTMLNRSMADRQGSEKWLREHPQAIPLTRLQKIKMARQHLAGASFRSLEAIWHLIPNSGNGAQRCVEQGLAFIKETEKARGKRREAVPA